MAESKSFKVMHCQGVKLMVVQEGGVRRVAPQLCVKAQAKAQADRAASFLLSMGVSDIKLLKEQAGGIVTSSDGWNPIESQYYGGWDAVKRFVKGFNHDRLLLTLADMKEAAAAVIDGTLSKNELLKAFSGKKLMLWHHDDLGRARREEDEIAAAAARAATVIILPNDYRGSVEFLVNIPCGMPITLKACKKRIRKA